MSRVPLPSCVALGVASFGTEVPTASGHLGRQQPRLPTPRTANLRLGVRAARFPDSEVPRPRRRRRLPLTWEATRSREGS